MAITQNTYTGNGSTTNYSFTFPYIQTSDIKASINGTVTTAFTLANATTISFNTAPADGAAIRIYRETADTTPIATFNPGSAIRSQDLNDNYTQILYISQETKTYATGTDASAVAATANAALNNSTAAVSTANTAQSTANAASSTANGIASTAQSALTTAQNAETVANAALPKTGGTMTGSIAFAAGQPTATIGSPGIVQLESSTSSTSTTTAATPSAVKSTYDFATTVQTTANAALPKAGGTMTGDVVFASTQTYPRIPQNAKTAAYTLIASDAGKHISSTTTVTVPAGVFSVGDTIDIYNNSALAISISPAATVTIRLAGTATVGARSLAQRGYATLVCVASNDFVAHGTGIT